MYIVFGAFFILSIAAGWAIGYLNQMTLFETLLSIGIAGFAGSGIIAVIFSYLYFFQKETDGDKIKRLQQEIDHIKQTNSNKRIE